MTEVEFEPGKLSDESKLRLGDGMIRYKLYQQDGSFQEMTCPDTKSNRLCVAWIQMFDRYTHQQGE